jgi:hypothetical protein
MSSSDTAHLRLQVPDLQAHQKILPACKTIRPDPLHLQIARSHNCPTTADAQIYPHACVTRTCHLSLMNTEANAHVNTNTHMDVKPINARCTRCRQNQMDLLWHTRKDHRRSGLCRTTLPIHCNLGTLKVRHHPGNKRQRQYSLLGKGPCQHKTAVFVTETFATVFKRY